VYKRQAQMPSHTHTLKASSQDQTTSIPTNNLLAKEPVVFFDAPNAPRAMSAGSISTTGGGQGHENRQPYLAVRFIIALVGTYPSRS